MKIGDPDVLVSPVPTEKTKNSLLTDHRAKESKFYEKVEKERNGV
jgi:hypothetical protein